MKVVETDILYLGEADLNNIASLIENITIQNFKSECLYNIQRAGLVIFRKDTQEVIIKNAFGKLGKIL